MSGGDTGIWVYVPDAHQPGWYEMFWERDDCPLCGNQTSLFLVQRGPGYTGGAWLEVLHACDQDLASLIANRGLTGSQPDSGGPS